MTFLRRTFLAGSAAAAASSSGAQPSNLRLGVDTYSLRSQGWKLPQMLDFAGKQKLDIIQASHGDFESFDEAYLLAIKEHAQSKGIQLEPGFGCISPFSKSYNVTRQGEPAAYLADCIRVARTLGAAAFKVFIGNSADRTGGTEVSALMESAIRNIRAVRTRAVDAGVKIAIENHGDLQSHELRTVIEEGGADAAACNFDSGNAPILAEDPIAALETLAPWIVTSHIRDSVAFEHPRGAAVQWVAMGDGVVDLKSFTHRFAELCPQAAFQLEILTGYPPRILPYLEPGYWKAFPTTSAASFARFIAFARQGRPFMGNMILAAPAAGGALPAEYRAALRLQERLDLERSLEYCRQTLGVGLRWRSA